MQIQAEALFDELQAYLKEPDLPHDADPLKYWQAKASPKLDSRGAVLQKAEFEILPVVARAGMSLSNTSVDVERLFRILGITFSDLRQSMKPQTLSDLMFCHINQDYIPDLKAFKEALTKERKETEARRQAAAVQDKVIVVA